MKYPQRVPKHITETRSFKALERCTPPEWMLRHVTERDYGIDTILEIVTSSGELRGDMIALQLKGTAELSWRTPPVATYREATFSGIATSTVNYWMGLPMPVFLLVHDEATEMLVATDVKREARRQYAKLESQSSISFTLLDASDLGHDPGLSMLKLSYFQEKSFPAFAGALIDLLFNAGPYHSLLDGSLGLDEFLPVEDNVLIPFLRLYRNTAAVAVATSIEHQLPPLETWFAEDSSAFSYRERDESTLLHQRTLDHAIHALAPAYIKALRLGRKRVTLHERDFWIATDALLVRFCESWTMQEQIASLEKLFGISPNEDSTPV